MLPDGNPVHHIQSSCTVPQKDSFTLNMSTIYEVFMELFEFSIGPAFSFVRPSVGPSSERKKIPLVEPSQASISSFLFGFRVRRAKNVAMSSCQRTIFYCLKSWLDLCCFPLSFKDYLRSFKLPLLGERETFQWLMKHDTHCNWAVLKSLISTRSDP